MEYSCRKKRTKREEFLEIMEEIIPWEEWVGIIAPYYPAGKRGRPPMGIEKMLRMYLLQIWFNLSDPGTEDVIYDSYAMRKFTGINFLTESVPDGRDQPCHGEKRPHIEGRHGGGCDDHQRAQFHKERPEGPGSGDAPDQKGK